MEKNPSFLFSGIKFDRKKFANDFAKFKEKKEADDSIDTLLETKPPEMEAGMAAVKKRKRNVAEPVEGFTVFKGSKSEVPAQDNDLTEKVFQRRKELNRQMERDEMLRKKHKLKVAGTNRPSPLESFAELRSRNWFSFIFIDLIYIQLLSFFLNFLISFQLKMNMSLVLNRYKCRRYLVRNLAELGFKEPTPIQRQAIPLLLSGRECFACAPTGSGKTLAFVFPILMKLKHASKDGVRAVILCPTRELAAQTARECKRLAKGKKFYIKLLTKQLVKGADFSKLPCDILISTPFRVHVAIRKRKLDLSRVEYLVLDESDKLFELGLVKQVDSVVKACSNPAIVRSLFSATLPDSVQELARSIMHDAVRVVVGTKNSASEFVKQKLIFAGSEEGKLLALRQSFQESLNPPILIFVQNKERAKDLYNELKFEDIRADVVHADLSDVLVTYWFQQFWQDLLTVRFQMQRENAVDNFRAGKTWVLIATDVIARGMDFKGVNCVINYDFPESAAAYIHRIGRTGRAGRTGEAITLYTEADVPCLRNIANVMKASGCEVPDHALSLRKQKWKHRPHREAISTKPVVEE
ncbi:hypothetical protein RJ640_007221 [Escallonia rubra]|uniref:RNA helicase n=1 Tax=Escallonia rubra TaxID=112253 RepID=A0AA88R958_9ASTE|nr:hypothetical protein RJ640_007221 [Escallonia rubra]